MTECNFNVSKKGFILDNVFYWSFNCGTIKKIRQRLFLKKIQVWFCYKIYNVALVFLNKTFIYNDKKTMEQLIYILVHLDKFWMF